MTAIHIHRVDCAKIREEPLDERWCFVCRRRQPFKMEVWAPTDPMSYYGPHANIVCPKGHFNGDLFPGRTREWE